MSPSNSNTGAASVAGKDGPNVKGIITHARQEVNR